MAKVELEILENSRVGHGDQNEILKQLGLEMFLTEVNLLLVLYNNGMRHKIKGKENFLFMAKEYFSKAMRGFKNDQQAKKTGMRTFNEETIAADTAYRELLVGIKNVEEFKIYLPVYIDTLQNIIDKKDVDSKKIDNITSILKSITAQIRKNHCEYLEFPISFLGSSGIRRVV